MEFWSFKFFSELWCFGVSEFLSFGVLENFRISMFFFSCFGVLELRIFRTSGVLEFWSFDVFGFFEFWNFRVLDFCNFGLWDFRYFRVWDFCRFEFLGLWRF